MSTFLCRVLAMTATGFGLTTPLAAQWSLGAAGSYTDFHGGARDQPGVTAEPSSRFESGISVRHSSPHWEFGLSVSWAPGHLSTRDSTGQALQIDALSVGFTRYRLAPSISRKLFGVGAGRVMAVLGPVLDLWNGDDQARPRLGGQIGAALEAPLGSWVLRNFVMFGVEESPFNADEFGPTIRRPALQAFSIGMELQLKL